MVVKKKTAKPDPELVEKEEERRPPVTQVVEVVEDGAETESAPDEAESSPMEEKTEQVEDSSQDQKRRELVDELFQKKTDESASVTPEITMHHSPSKKRPIVGWAITMIVVCLIVGGGMYGVSTGAVSIPTLMATPTPTPTSTPTPTPTPDVTQLDKSTLSVQVLNGSGIVGEAGKMKTLLEEKGYTVDNTGNAETYDYETTKIMVKAESEAYVALLEEDLKESYSLDTSEATLPDDVPYDVRIIVGKNEL